MVSPPPLVYADCHRLSLQDALTLGVLHEHKVHNDRAVRGALIGPTGSSTVEGTVDLTGEGRSLSLLEVLEGDTLLGSVEHGSSLSIDTTSLTPGVHEVHPRVTYYVSALDQYVTWTGAPVEIDVANPVSISSLGPADVYFTPNGDGVHDDATVDFTLSDRQ